MGWGIRERAPRKKVNLELGNNSPVIIEPDGDWRGAAAKLKIAGFSHAGQSCISAQRLLVHRSIHDEFVAALSGEVETLVVGPPLDEATDVSALISSGDTERVKGWIDDAVAAGAKVAVGGDVGDDGVLQPTVLTDVTPDMKVCATEVFGPVVGVAAYDDLDEALRWPTTPATGCRPRSSLPASTPRWRRAPARLRRRDDQRGADLEGRPAALRGPARQRQHPRGPRYAVREMTEHRLIVIQP